MIAYIHVHWHCVTENNIVIRWNFAAIYHSSRDINTSGLRGHIVTSGCRSFAVTYFELVAIGDLTVAVLNDHIICGWRLRRYRNRGFWRRAVPLQHLV